MNAAAGLDHVAGRLSDPDPQKSLVRHQEVFRLDLHSFLTHASNVSRLLWPTPKSSLPRGLRVRQVLGLPDDEHVLSIASCVIIWSTSMNDWTIGRRRANATTTSKTQSVHRRASRR